MAWRIFLLLLASIPVLGQLSPQAMQSRLRMARASANPDSIAHYLGWLGYYHLTQQNYDSADYYCREAVSYAKRSGNKQTVAYNLNNIGLVYQRFGNLDSSIYYLNEAYNVYLELRDSARATVLEVNIGMLHMDRGLYEKSLEYLLAAAYRLEKLGPSTTLATAYNNIGLIYSRTDEPSTALDYHKRALAVRHHLGQQQGVSASLNNIGNAYISLKQYDSALVNFEKCLAIKRKLKDRSGEGICLNNMGELKVRTGNLEEAEQLLRESLSIRLRLNEKSGQVNTRNNLARVYLLRGNLTAAERELKLSEEMAISIGLLDELKVNYELQVRLYREMNEMDDALAYSERLLAVKDSLLNQEKAKSLAEMQTRYESLKKEDRIALLEKEGQLQALEIDRKQIWIRSLVGGIFLILVIVVLIYHNLRTTRRNKQHIELLLKELHHRVKNNLQILSSLLSLQSQQLTDDTAVKAVKSSESRINAMALIHRKLYTVDQNRTVDIKEYITELIQYLVYSYGYHEKNFKLDLDINEISIDVDKAIPLGLILNELISNAFKHAYENQPNPSLCVDLAYPDVHQLNIRIRDNGPGMSRVDEKERKTFGMKIVNTLIKELKGSLNVRSDNGTTYELNIPI